MKPIPAFPVLGGKRFHAMQPISNCEIVEFFTGEPISQNTVDLIKRRRKLFRREERFKAEYN